MVQASPKSKPQCFHSGIHLNSCFLSFHHWKGQGLECCPTHTSWTCHSITSEYDMQIPSPLLQVFWCCIWCWARYSEAQNDQSSLETSANCSHWLRNRWLISLILLLQRKTEEFSGFNKKKKKQVFLCFVLSGVFFVLLLFFVWLVGFCFCFFGSHKICAVLIWEFSSD